MTGFGRVLVVNDVEYNEIQELQEQIAKWLEIMEEDTHFAVPEVILEQWWNRLDLLICSSIDDEDL